MRQIAQFLCDFPVTDHGAQFFRRPGQKGLFFIREFRGRESDQAVPVRLPAKQIRFPPDGTGFQRFALGVGHVGHDLCVKREDRFYEQLPAQGSDCQKHGNRYKNRPCKH